MIFRRRDFEHAKSFCVHVRARGKLCVRKREDMRVTNITLICSSNCTKLVFKHLTAKKGLSISVLCTAPFL